MATDGAQKPTQIAGVFQAAVRSFTDDRRCFQLSRVLGSMLVFDFGRATSKSLRAGRQVLIGTGTLSVRNTYWRVSGSDRRLNAELLDDELFSVMNQLFVDRELLGVDATPKMLRFLFSKDLTLNVDIANVWRQEDDDEVCVFSAQGISVSLFPNRQVLLRSDQDEKAAA